MNHNKASIEVDRLNFEKTALVVIDLQRGIISRESVPHSPAHVVNNASRLVKAFEEKGAYIVLVRVSTSDGGDMLKPKTDLKVPQRQLTEGWDTLVPELENIKRAHHITKRQWGAFYGTDLDLQLRRRGIDTIVLCGVSTGIGVDTTAREAYQHGYHQIFAEDAMAAFSLEEHEYVCNHIFPRIGKVRTCEEIIRILD